MNEIRYRGEVGKTVYAVINDVNGKNANITSSVFETQVNADWADYKLLVPPVSAGSNSYQADFPSWINAGTYEWTLYEQVGGAPSMEDPQLGGKAGFIWSGTAEVPLSSLFSSLGGGGVSAPSAGAV